MDWTPILVAAIQAVPTTVVALVAVATLVVGIRNNRKSGEIHTLVNTNYAKLEAKLADRDQRIEVLLAAREAAHPTTILGSVTLQPVGSTTVLPPGLP